MSDLGEKITAIDAAVFYAFYVSPSCQYVDSYTTVAKRQTPIAYTWPGPAKPPCEAGRKSAVACLITERDSAQDKCRNVCKSIKLDNACILETHVSN